MPFFTEDEHQIIAAHLDKLEVIIHEHMKPIIAAMAQRIGPSHVITMRMKSLSLALKKPRDVYYSQPNRMRLQMMKLYFLERDIPYLEGIIIPTPYDKLRQVFKSDEAFIRFLKKKVPWDGVGRRAEGSGLTPKQEKNSTSNTRKVERQHD